MTWTAPRIARLKQLWAEGRSASEIADILGDVTRNGVIGKSHRLGLSSRPSPIKRRPEPGGQLRGCQWPEGDPKDPTFHFCGAKRVSGKPYCAEHCARAYRRPFNPNWSDEQRAKAKVRYLKTLDAFNSRKRKRAEALVA